LVSLDDAVIARYKKKDENFEILVDPYIASDFLEGKKVNIINNLAIDSIFEDVKKGEHASEEALQKSFGTTNIEEISKIILKKGKIQLTT
jgi:ribosome maturation protein SDO1